MKEKVFFLPSHENDDIDSLCTKLENFIRKENFFDFIDENDMVAIKSHFGETEGLGTVKPPFLKMMGDIVKEKKALPFLTETSTLYKGGRDNAVNHIKLANEHGYSIEKTGMPLIMADGLIGDEEIAVKVPGKIYDEVNIASMIVKTQALIMVSHFTGHILAGFGAALKNMGMGCSSRKGKMIQHSDAKPKIKKRKCTRCGQCIKWCPVSAISMQDDGAVIDKAECIGCGECLAVCRFDAVKFSWKTTYDLVQKKIVEHAWGVAESNENKIVYINFLTSISKDCDCMDKSENIVTDIGILLSHDPVAIDAASLDLVEERGGKTVSEMCYDIPYRFQVDYAKEIGFGNSDYEIVEIS